MVCFNAHRTERSIHGKCLLCRDGTKDTCRCSAHVRKLNRHASNISRPPLHQPHTHARARARTHAHRRNTRVGETGSSSFVASTQPKRNRIRMFRTQCSALHCLRLNCQGRGRFGRQCILERRELERRLALQARRVLDESHAVLLLHLRAENAPGQAAGAKDEPRNRHELQRPQLASLLAPICHATISSCVGAAPFWTGKVCPRLSQTRASNPSHSPPARSNRPRMR